MNLQAMEQVEGPDLANANLSGVDLRGARMLTPNLDGADLSGATLAGLDLRQAQFGATSFIGADLTGADLRRANLRSADLRGANLTGAVLPDKLSAFDGARFDASTRWDETMRAQAEANSVAESDGTRVITVPKPPAPQPDRWPVVGRVIAFPLGVGAVIHAVLIATSESFIADEPAVNIVIGVVGVLLYCLSGLPWCTARSSVSPRHRAAADAGAALTATAVSKAASRAPTWTERP